LLFKKHDDNYFILTWNGSLGNEIGYTCVFFYLQKNRVLVHAWKQHSDNGVNFRFIAFEN